jgi:dipeptidyl aminopeptidase/acylaminoacyl peptidase
VKVGQAFWTAIRLVSYLDSLPALPNDKQTLPYGSWPTRITSELVVAQAVRVYDAKADGADLIWSEARPAEGGRTTLVRRGADGDTTELLSRKANARTAVHEYGGGAWWVRDGVLWYAEWADQRLYRRDPDSGEATALTPEPDVPKGDRFADGDVSPDGHWIACVREHHPRGGGVVDVRNEIVRLAAHEPSTPEVLVSGPDFASSPRWSPDGRRLCWVQWEHPNMPWDSTTLYVRTEGSDPEVVAGTAGESVVEPRWAQDGSLLFISDRTGWWNIYRWDPDGGEVGQVTDLEAEVALPQWVLGGSRYALLDGGTIVLAQSRGGFDRISARLPDGTIKDLDLPFTSVRSLRRAGPDQVVLVAAEPTAEGSVVRITITSGGDLDGVDTVQPPRDLSALGVASGFISVPEEVELPSAQGRTTYALIYEPASPDVTGPDDELPPLLVDVHGGPTAAAGAELDLEIQYWTSRGFVVACVNYGGSTGYGREYRDLLQGTWGVVDVEDSIAVARWLADQGRVDPRRMAIRGGSAGGYTTLAALVAEDNPFSAGGDYFGVADLEAMTIDTHKFESRYLDGLIAPYPEGQELYRERSPISHIDRFSQPLIVLQGLEDEVVPPNQATMIVDALQAKRVPVAYLPFEGEQHGFRRQENIRRALDGELSFYSQIFGFELPAAEGIEPVELR